MDSELASDYSEYLKIDLEHELKTPKTAIDELLTRLDEFENLLLLMEMKQRECVDAQLPNLVAFRPLLDSLCNRVDRVEELVEQVEMSVTALELAADKAENDLQGGSKTIIKSFLKPLFQKPPSESSNSSVKNGHTLELPSLFNADLFFDPPPSIFPDSAPELKQ